MKVWRSSDRLLSGHLLAGRAVVTIQLLLVVFLIAVGTGMVVSPQSSAVAESSAGVNTWVPLSREGAPSARALQTAVWTGQEMIIWGGGPMEVNRVGSGARYNPAMGAWTPVSKEHAPSSRSYASAVWTGTEMLVWGGTRSAQTYDDGAGYNPTSD